MFRTIALIFLTAFLSLAADLTGKWELRGTSSDGEQTSVQLIVRDSGGTLSAVVNIEGGSIPVKDLTVTGDDVSFKISAEGTTYTLKLVLKDGFLKGTYSGTDGKTGKVDGKKA
ncbi:MAG: hypothetical protein NTV52_21945 [Acidobacteria bacterium]|nr:hypothetical protein [Acidobacteriota bacterium]